MITFEIEGEQCRLIGGSYECPRLRLYGYATDRKLAAAIRRAKREQVARRARWDAAIGLDPSWRETQL